MQVEAGKYYRTRDGRKVGPVKRIEGGWPWESEDCYYHEDGTAPYLSESDLVAEWQGEGPVRTVTTVRQEVVPGTYGIVTVYMVGDSVRTEFIKSNADALELRAAAIVLNQIADAL